MKLGNILIATKDSTNDAVLSVRGMRPRVLERRGHQRGSHGNGRSRPDHVHVHEMLRTRMPDA
jgi:hypothetical protein